jgi:UDP-N-acetylmuramate dehydrogenase
MIEENIDLTNLNTFHIRAKARFFSSFSSSTQLSEILQSIYNKNETRNLPLFILGGGSNILLLKDYAGIVLKNEIRGIAVVHEDNDHVYVRVGAGENWHAFVLHCIKHGLAGVENLSLIPGNVGASPMQNIGAYGVEIREVFESLSAFHLRDKQILTFTVNDCRFGYRESIFKNQYRNEFVILEVIYRLNKRPIFHTSYGAVQQELEKMGVKELSIGAISQAVMNIRSSKLPDPAVIGNAGSFFKNPQLSQKEFDELNDSLELRKLYPDMPTFPGEDGNIKIPAAWLIEQCGWKGYRRGDAGCHAKQPLVLVNYGNANGDEIYQLSEEILQSVKGKFGITLEREVNIV